MEENNNIRSTGSFSGQPG